MQVYELITCVRRANENAGNLISGVQFLINRDISSYVSRLYVISDLMGRSVIILTYHECLFILPNAIVLYEFLRNLKYLR